MRILARCLLAVAAVLTLGPPAVAHVGSPDIFFEGTAGPYRLFVTVRLPLVIPGVAEIGIRSESNDLRELRIVPLRLTGPGSSLPPTPDVARRSKEDSNSFSGSLWLMEGGSLQVRILADGARGKGEISVPVPAVAQGVLPMQKGLGGLLLGLMLFLAAGAVSIAAAGAREVELDPGALPGLKDARRSRLVMIVTAAVLLGLIYLGGSWWKSEATTYAGNVYRPPHVNASLDRSGRLVLRGEAGRIPTGFRGHAAKGRLDDLIPDHGHLVHLFLIRMPNMDMFWHLHPEQTGPGTFVQGLPAVSAGRYRIFADIVHRSGFPETMVGEIDVPDMPGNPPAGDDCGWSGMPVSETGEHSRESALPDGGRMIWIADPNRPLTANIPMAFRFRIEDKDGHPARDMEPYMGMLGHAEFVRADTSTFAHVHPAGSVSMAALELAQSSLIPSLPDNMGSSGGDHTETGKHAGMVMPQEDLPAELSFPYGFPRPGTYRIFVQIKRAGRIETAVFDAKVESEKSKG